MKNNEYVNESECENRRFHSKNCATEGISAIDVMKSGRYETFRELLFTLARVESKYKNAKASYELAKNEAILKTNWNEVNKEREKQGLPKIGNMDMKSAYVELENKCLHDNVMHLELKYKMLKRDYEVALKYSLDVVR